MKRLWVSNAALLDPFEELLLPDELPFVPAGVASELGGVDGAGEGRWNPSVRESIWGLKEVVE